MGQRRPAYTTETSPNAHSQKGIVYYLSLSTYRTNPIVSLVQYDSLYCLDSTSVAYVRIRHELLVNDEYIPQIH